MSNLTPNPNLNPNPNLTEQLVAFIGEEVATHEAEPITESTDLLLTGLVDSLGVVRIVAWMEDTLGITIDPTDVTLEHFQTIALMVAYASRREVA
jgi:acyl carrier protein